MANFIKSYNNGEYKYLRVQSNIPPVPTTAEAKINWGENATVGLVSPVADEAYWIDEYAPSHDPQYLTALTDSEKNRLYGSWPGLDFPNGTESDNILLRYNTVPETFTIGLKPTDTAQGVTRLDYKLYTGNDTEIYHGHPDVYSHDGWGSFTSYSTDYTADFPSAKLYGFLRYDTNPTPRKIPITYLTGDNGSLTGPADAYMGDNVDLTPVPDEGFELDTITINGEPIAGSSFTMPNLTSVSASASFTLTATGYVLRVRNQYGNHIFVSGFSGLNNPPILSASYDYTTGGTANDMHSTQGWLYMAMNSAKSNADSISFVYSCPITVTSEAYLFNSTATLWRGVADAVSITSHPNAFIASAKCNAPSAVITLPLTST